jgi:hypothetical protein
MKIKFMLAICLALLIFGNSVFAQQNINSFWKKFKVAVINADKNAVANMTKFPLQMPFGIKSVKTKADFIKRYSKIMNMEANVKRCFQNTKLEKQDKYYFVSCTFKSEDESSDNRPILYYFEKTKSSWKFSWIDNINE